MNEVNMDGDIAIRIMSTHGTIFPNQSYVVEWHHGHLFRQLAL
jgi:hypothetical protein